MAGSHASDAKATVLFGPPISWKDSKPDADTISLATFKPRYGTSSSSQMRGPKTTPEPSPRATSQITEQKLKAARVRPSKAEQYSSQRTEEGDDVTSSTISEAVASRRSVQQVDKLDDTKVRTPDKCKPSRLPLNGVGVDESVNSKGSLVVAHYEYLEGYRNTTPVKSKASGLPAPRTPRTPRASDSRYSLRKSRVATSAVSETSSLDTSASYRSSAVSQKSKRGPPKSPLAQSRASVQHRLRPQSGTNADSSFSSAPAQSIDDRLNDVSYKDGRSKRAAHSKVSLREPSRYSECASAQAQSVSVVTVSNPLDDLESVSNSYVHRSNRPAKYAFEEDRDLSVLRASDVSIGYLVSPAVDKPASWGSESDHSWERVNYAGRGEVATVDASLDQDKEWSSMQHRDSIAASANPFISGPRVVKNSQDLFEYHSSAEVNHEVLPSKSESLEFPRLSESQPLHTAKNLLDNDHDVDVLKPEKVDVGVIKVDASPASEREEIVVYKHPVQSPLTQVNADGCRCCSIM